MTVSIIIPTYNEAPLLGAALDRLRRLQPAPDLVVADGGSGDGSADIAAAGGARLVRCQRRGRAFQMNAGATAAEGATLLFLHADLELSQAAWDALRCALEDPRVVGGAFRRFFRSPSLVLRVGAHLASWRSRWWGLYFGDQAIFVRRPIFDQLGGFPDILLFEDLEFSRALRRAGRSILIDEPIFASSRRFEREGALRRLWANWLLTGRYLLGQHPDELARLYYPEHFQARDRAHQVETHPLSLQAPRVPTLSVQAPQVRSERETPVQPGRRGS
ncbi:MAG TPA: TIGR04283 family arsenosugar biosynthesis glycosyltransferase [Acidobacteriota bacterium]